MDRIAAAQIKTVTITSDENKQITSLTRIREWPDPVAAPEAYVLEAQMLSGSLPERIRRELLRFRVDGSRRGGILLRNVPLGAVPPTPNHADEGVGIHLESAQSMSMIVALIGEQFGFRPELGGRIVQDILPVPGFEDTQQSISSRALLELHCETVFTDSRSDFVALLCLRPDHRHAAATLLSPALKVLARLDQATIDVLKQPRFCTTVDGSFLRGSGLDHAVVVQPIIVVSGSEDHPRLRCDFAETKGLDQCAQQAVDTLYAAACQAAAGVHLDAGDLLIVDNHSTFHGRTPFPMRQDGKDRWLLRSFVARDISRSIQNRPNAKRIIDIDYSAISAQTRGYTTVQDQALSEHPTDGSTLAAE